MAASTIVLRLTVITRSQSASLTSTTVPRWEMPTLLSRMSTRPYRSTAAWAMRSQSSSLVMSPWMVDASPPSCLITSSVSLARSSTMSTSRTLAPSRANRMDAALPFPIPSPLEPAPVTMATLPSSLGARSAIGLTPGRVQLQLSGAAHGRAAARGTIGERERVVKDGFANDRQSPGTQGQHGIQCRAVELPLSAI